MNKRILVLLCFMTAVCTFFFWGCFFSSGSSDSLDEGSWTDIHGAGCQRSDPKSGSLSDYAYADYGYYNEEAPQGDAVRIDNYVRLVRDVSRGSETCKIVDTDQTTFFNDSEEITEPSSRSDDFYGQDAQFTGNAMSYTVSDDGSTVTDNITGLTWMRGPNTSLDSPDADDKMSRSEAIEYVASMNDASYGGYSDWRLPNVKELQSIVDYSHSPDYDGKAAIDMDYFNCTSITNENNETDYPWYWTGTTHESRETSGSGSAGVYVSFGRAMGYSSTDL